MRCGVPLDPISNLYHNGASMSPNKLEYLLGHNPLRLSQVELAQREAEDVARHTGRTIIDRHGNEVPSKIFVRRYTDLILDRL